MLRVRDREAISTFDGRTLYEFPERCLDNPPLARMLADDDGIADGVATALSVAGCQFAILDDCPSSRFIRGNVVDVTLAEILPRLHGVDDPHFAERIFGCLIDSGNSF